ncbi:hypothetical protein ACH4U6_35430 [Streptomyces netropsis]|uniref:hypothetical protein n=1 Tax=Streptomyces netropsis TaxID=55404 RepID=UPI0037B82225
MAETKKPALELMPNPNGEELTTRQNLQDFVRIFIFGCIVSMCLVLLDPLDPLG